MTTLMYSTEHSNYNSGNSLSLRVCANIPDDFPKEKRMTWVNSLYDELKEFEIDANKIGDEGKAADCLFERLKSNLPDNVTLTAPKDIPPIQISRMHKSNPNHGKWFGIYLDSNDTRGFYVDTHTYTTVLPQRAGLEGGQAITRPALADHAFRGGAAKLL